MESLYWVSLWVSHPHLPGRCCVVAADCCRSLGGKNGASWGGGGGWGAAVSCDMAVFDLVCLSLILLE